MGGLVTGSGFALGPEYLRRDLARGRLLLRGTAQSSFSAYQKYDLQFSMPPTARSRFFFDTQAVHRNYPGLDYYGPGPQSSKLSRSTYRLEDTQFNATAGLQLLPQLGVGGSFGYTLLNAGPGTEDDFISADKVFTPGQTPGIQDQANYTRQSLFAQYDTRDNPGGPRSGSNYLVEYTFYQDRSLGRHDFDRLDLHLQQYVSFFNQRRVFALRAHTSLAFTDTGQSVPFYLQPIIGGSENLRGYRPFRFYDDNSLILNAEYRWETFSGMDMAIFADAGKVFHRRSELDFSNLESDVGFGFRFNARNNVFLRVDVGFSQEGVQVWVKFNNIFSEGRFGAPATQTVF